MITVHDTISAVRLQDQDRYQLSFSTQGVLHKNVDAGTWVNYMAPEYSHSEDLSGRLLKV